MKTGKTKMQVFKIKNRRGYAVVCSRCLTEGATVAQAQERMSKALRRMTKKR